jgi:hypothetical protein
VQLDVTFGNATPAVIPTFTPAPTRTPDPKGTAPALVAQTPINANQATIPAGSPGAGSPVPTLRGGVTSATPGAPSTGVDDNGGGFPLWGIVLLVLIGVAAIGGGVGYAMSRNRAIDDDEQWAPPDDEL